MKPLLAVLMTFLVCASLPPFPVEALEAPLNYGYVTDLGGVLSGSTEAKLESYLSEFERSDSTQIGILTIPTLDGEVLEEYSMKVFDRWKFGQKGIDNGVILLFARAEGMVRIEVGYGLEGRLTDLLAGRIVDHVLLPRIRQGNFEDAIVAGVKEIGEAVRGEYQGTGHAIGD